MKTLLDSPSPLYLTIGVTGHRDIPPEDEAILKPVIKSRLLNLQASYQETPLLLLSGLAEGADRLVVEVAYELGIAFAAILPLPKEDYATDFTETRSKQDFYNWLDKALWDGDKQEKTGGTAQVVRYFLQGLTGKPQDKASVLNLPSYRPVEHILTRRLSHQ
jgi:hypothetical protein